MNPVAGDVASPTAPPASARYARRDVVSVLCAASAGVHAALVPHHLHESVRLGSAFLCSAIALALVAVVVRPPRRARWPPATAAAVLAATALAYMLSRTVGLPGLLDTPETIDPLGVVTTAAEAVGVWACLPLLYRKD
jgi:peptidoglycan/LPS O-acetylase OafA/YrhL